MKQGNDPKLPTKSHRPTELPGGRDGTERPAGPFGSNESPATDDQPFGVANLQLCRKVSGFGAVEPWGERTMRPGQRVLIYCEMTGLQYEPTRAGFISRLSSRVELRAAGNDAVIWEQEMGIAQDACPRVRHDYYVSYRLKLPDSLPTGKHRLRIVQTDLVTERSAFSEVGLTIAR